MAARRRDCRGRGAEGGGEIRGTEGADAADVDEGLGFFGEGKTEVVSAGRSWTLIGGKLSRADDAFGPVPVSVPLVVRRAAAYMIRSPSRETHAELKESNAESPKRKGKKKRFKCSRGEPS